ncbi:MAG: PilZ domain-containing protein [Planctomycetota bacterium]
MATAMHTINLFSWNGISEAESLPLDLAAYLLTAAILAVLGCVALWRLLQRSRATAAGRRRGLSAESAALFGRLAERAGRKQAEAWLSDPEVLRRRLAETVRGAVDLHVARQNASVAKRLLQELGANQPPFQGAPAVFEELLLLDAADPTTVRRTVFAVAVDEHSLTVIALARGTTLDECPWPAQHKLLVSPRTEGEGYRASLLLRPMPPHHEWVLNHDLIEVINNRRAAERVPCRIEVHTLPEDLELRRLRERLLLDERLGNETLRNSPVWARRRDAVLLDVSSGGCCLALEQALPLGTRLHVVLLQQDGRLLGLPLAEVVSVRTTDENGLCTGLRFVGLRLRERLALAERVRQIAAAATELPAAAAVTHSSSSSAGAAGPAS